MKTESVAPDLGYLRLVLVNVYLYGLPDAGDRGWVLIDAGIPGPGVADRIIQAAAERFGPDARPSAIVLTHGHFDHVGTLRALAEHWDAPVYAHRLELPYLTGRRAYLPPDPTVGGGAMSLLSPLYPRGPFRFEDRVAELPGDGTVPGMPGWQWIHTPGHSPGHISLFREDDRALIAGDAFVTTRQESVIGVAAWQPRVHRPPAYFTPDWAAARDSVRRLAALEPELAATGHGPPMRGREMRLQLHALADRFDTVALPRHGRYVGRPLFQEPLPRLLLGVGAAVALIVVGRLARR
ncbi:MAG TPA: MBL fold metallo-hydrolase [Gemmatimonadales bacterium]|nr:MBL fold metallo-hydrolase [Gemmatimonadales bacterium]